jgi:hypothetical protein
VAHAQPTVLSAVHVGRINIGATVEDRTVLCLEITAAMRFEDPNLPGTPICLETIGDVRDRALRLRAAN